MKWETFDNQGENAETHEDSNPTVSANANDDSDKTVGNIEAYCNSPEEFNFITLQNNLQNCLAIVDSDVMKSYVPELQNCQVKPMEKEVLQELEQIQFFRISELVYQEDEFSVHKLATVFHTLSNKPCTLVLLIQSDGENSEFYLGIRSRDCNYSSGTMRQLLEQSFLGMFPGSSVGKYYVEELQEDIKQLKIGAVSSVTSIADYKQDKEYFENKSFIQGLEKLVYGIQGKEVAVVCIANNLKYCDLTETRSEYERIYTLMSPFTNVQYNYALNKSSSTSDSKMESNGTTKSEGNSTGTNTNETHSQGEIHGTSSSRTQTDTEGKNSSTSSGSSHTNTQTQGNNESNTITHTTGGYGSAGIGIGNVGVTSSVSRGKTYGVSYAESISNLISENLTKGFSKSRSVGNTEGITESVTNTSSTSSGKQFSKNESISSSVSYAQTKALTDTFGNSQAVTLNIQNKSLMDTLKRLEKQLERLDECESSGMWDFAAYFLGESASETETAASIYRSLISGNQSGLQLSAVNTWTDENSVKNIAEYVINFLHPVFQYHSNGNKNSRCVYVDATALSSTNELAIQMGLPRKSVKGLPVIEHALFAQEVLKYGESEKGKEMVKLGVINHLGKVTETKVELDLQSLASHTFIVGATGSGKSNTIYKLIDELTSVCRDGMSFMIIEPAKGEYKRVFGHRKNVTVLGTNPAYSKLLKINPFRFPKGIHVLEHIDRLIEIFNVCWPMYAAMPAVLKEAILATYESCGWDMVTSANMISDDFFPTFQDLLENLVTVINESSYSDEVKSNYKGALLTRVKSLTNGLNGMIFASEEIDNHVLFDTNVVIDLSRVGSQETKALLMGILVMRLSEYRMTQAVASNQKLRHITVLEEAHNILKSSISKSTEDGGDISGKSVEMISNAIAEMRTYGEGFIIADQSPNAVDISAIRNTNTKIIMRLPEESDRRLAGKSAALKDYQLDEIARLPKGVAVVYQNDWLEPVLCQIDKFSGEEKEYVKDTTVEQEKQDKAAARIIINLIIKNRLDAPEKICPDEIEKAIKRIKCSVRTKAVLYALVDEYRLDGKIHLWKSECFAEQASLVQNVLGLESAVLSARRMSVDTTGFNRYLNTIVSQKISELTDDLLISIEHCLLKAYSEVEKDGLQYYENWYHSFAEGRGLF